MSLQGRNFVRFTRHGLQAARSLWPRTRDRFEVRRQALKLRFWDTRHDHPPGRLFDNTYESVKGLSDIYEFRLDDTIGGLSNVRIILFDPPKDWQPFESRPMRIIWILEAFPKKRNDFSNNDLRRFKASRLMLAQRCYGKLLP
jgi:hypothetical protein